MILIHLRVLCYSFPLLFLVIFSLTKKDYYFVFIVALAGYLLLFSVVVVVVFPPKALDLSEPGKTSVSTKSR